MSSDVRDQGDTLINDLAARNNSEGKFNQERTYLRSFRDLQLVCSQSTSAVEDNLVGLYRNEADSIGQRSAMQMADTSEGGVAACAQYMSEARRTQWKREALQTRRTGIETEMAEISVDDLPGVDRDALAEEMQRNTETIVDSVLHKAG